MDFIQKTQNIELVRKILENKESDILNYLSENNAEYVEQHMEVPLAEKWTLIKLAKEMPEMKSSENWEKIETCYKKFVNEHKIQIKFKKQRI